MSLPLPALASNGPRLRSSKEAQNSPIARRRKLRRGTTSCWECKRRKIRCYFEARNLDICESCRHRGCKCVPQHIPQGDPGTELDSSSREDETSHSPAVEHHGPPNQKEQSHLTKSARKLLPRLNRASSKGHTASQLKISSWHAPLTSDNRPNHPLGTLGDLHFLMDRLPESNELTMLIQSILPPPNTAAQIMFRSKTMLPLRISSKLSDPLTSQPILMAQKLMQLAVSLRQMDPTSSPSELQLDGSVSDVAGRYFEAASRYVTSQDALVVSIDGLETLILECLYHIFSGHWRLAWLVTRRALGIAHLLGIHLPKGRQRGRVTGASTVGANTTLEIVWHRLVSVDRYLSLILRFPLSVTDDSFSCEEVLAELAPLERLNRLHTTLAGRIINRNERLIRSSPDIYDHYRETKLIDHDMKQAAKALPTNWWTAVPGESTRTDTEMRDITMRVATQIHHYHLLVLLHLPYIIPSPSIWAAGDYTYCTLAALTASRELLARTSGLLRPPSMPHSSRILTPKTFVAVLTLLLAHLESHRSGRDDALDHQRPQDMGIVERAIDGLEVISLTTNDRAVSVGAQVLRKLSNIEAAAADGTAYDLWSEPGAVSELECAVGRDDEFGLELELAYLGSVRITRRDLHGPVTSLPSLEAGVSGRPELVGDTIGHPGSMNVTQQLWGDSFLAGLNFPSPVFESSWSSIGPETQRPQTSKSGSTGVLSAPYILQPVSAEHSLHLVDTARPTDPVEVSRGPLDELDS